MEKDFHELLEVLSVADLEMIAFMIKNSEEFKNLAQKTQIKNSGVENEDLIHNETFNNRQRHSVQVAEIAKTIIDSQKNDNINVSDEMKKKEALIAYITGLCHDFGHTPFGHDGETFFTAKTGEWFAHAKYGQKVFKRMFSRIIETQDQETEEEIFSNEKRNALKALSKYIEAGISFHQSGYYTSEIDGQLEEIRKKQKDGEKLSESEEMELIAFETPAIQAAMLSDTVAIMQSDVRDITIANKPIESNEHVLTQAEMKEIAKSIRNDRYPSHNNCKRINEDG